MAEDCTLMKQVIDPHSSMISCVKISKNLFQFLFYFILGLIRDTIVNITFTQCVSSVMQIATK